MILTSETQEPTAVIRFAFFLALLCFAAAAGGQSVTTTTLTINPGGTVREGSLVTLTARVWMASGVAAAAPGQVEFCEVKPAPMRCTDIRLLGTVQLSAAGTAVYNFFPGPGTHVYQAVFLGTHVEAASSSSPTTYTVTPYYPTFTTITSSGSPGNYTLTASVTGGTVQTGTASFMDTSNANYVLATAPMVPDLAAFGLNFNFASPSGTYYVASSMAAADFTGNGILDIIVTSASNILNPVDGGSVRSLLGNGDGTFTQAPFSFFPAPNGNARPAVADFNGDGKPDFVIPTAQGIGIGTTTQLQVMLGNGDGTFTAGQALPTNGGVYSIATGDFNGDGIEDLAVPDGTNNTVDVYLGNGDGTFTFKSMSALPVDAEATAIVAGDWNGDGIPDLAVLDTENSVGTPHQVSILLGNGDGTFGPGVSYTTGTDSESMVAADFNGKGILDLAFVNWGGTLLSVLLGNGDGTFAPPAQIPIPNGSASPAVGDFNGDGVADIAFGNTAPDVSVLLGHGDGTFAPAVVVPSATGSGIDPMVAADFNGDGLTDLAGLGDTPTSGTQAGMAEVLVYLSNLGSETATATATVSNISPVGTGTHLVDASYSGDGAHQPSTSGTIPLIAEPEPTTLTLTANPASSSYSQQIVLTAIVSPDTAQDHNATGTVTFAFGNVTLGTVAISDGAATAVATLNVTSLPVGTDSLTASYSGDTYFAASMGTAAQVVSGYASTTVLTATPDPSYVGQAVTLTAVVTEVGTAYFTRPSGSVTFYDGATELGQVTLGFNGGASNATTITTALAAGTHTLSAVYSGDVAYYASTSAPVTQVVNLYGSATTLTAAPNPAGTGQTVTLTAGVTGTGPAIPGGMVTFYDGATQLGQATLDATGHATYSTTTLALGTHTLTAVYAGTATYSASTSAAVSEVIQTPGFTIALSSPSITLQTYHHTTTTVTLTSLGNFTDNIVVACVNPPAYVTCIFTPNPAALTGNSITAVAFYLDTDSIIGGDARKGPTSALAVQPKSSRNRTSASNLALLVPPLGLLAILTARRRGRLGRRITHRTLLLLALLFIPAALSLGGCGGDIFFRIPSAAPGTYTIPITAASTSTGLSQAAQLTLTVTP
jgi:hypothetical protein